MPAMPRKLLVLLITAVVATGIGACGKTPAEQEAAYFQDLLHASDLSKDREELVRYLNQSHGPEADRLINQGMVRWAVSNRNHWPKLQVRLNAARIDGMNRAAEALSP